MRRRALIVANGQFADPKIMPLESPVGDARRLATLLARSDVGGYDVTPCHDENERNVRLAINRFFRTSTHDDLNLVLLSSHGKRDPSGRLHYVAADTQLEDLNATAIETRYVYERLRESRGSKHVLFVDICHSGAFFKGTNEKRAGADRIEKDDFGGDAAAGYAVIAASSATQSAYENAHGGVMQSVFTRHLIEGIETGAADRDQSGKITVDGLFEHIRGGLQRDSPGQRPEPNYGGLPPTTVIALNPRARPPALPADLAAALASSERLTRAAALVRLLQLAQSHERVADTAAAALRRAADRDDSRLVRNIAAGLVSELDASGAEWVPPEAAVRVVRPGMMIGGVPEKPSTKPVLPEIDAGLKPGLLNLPPGEYLKRLYGEAVASPPPSTAAPAVSKALVGLIPQMSKTDPGSANLPYTVLSERFNRGLPWQPFAQMPLPPPVDPADLVRKARALRDGDGVAQDLPKAVELLRQAVELGDADAEADLGFMHDHGIGVPANPRMAARLYRAAANKGISRAQFNLGCCYHQGNGVVRNSVTANRWYRKAIAQGDIDALVNLGVNYENGDGVSAPNHEKASEFYRRAAEAGDIGGQFNYAQMLRTGRGTAVDRTQARRWLEKVLANTADDPETKAKAKKMLAELVATGR